MVRGWAVYAYKDKNGCFAHLSNKCKSKTGFLADIYRVLSYLFVDALMASSIFAENFSTELISLLSSFLPFK